MRERGESLMNIPVIALGSLIVLQLIPWIIFSRKWNARIKQIYRAFFALTICIFVIVVALMIA